MQYEGISRMHTSIRRRHVDRVVRRGMAMIIESDFYTTAAGRKHFQDQVLSIRMAVQETCNFDVMHAYLTAPNKDFEYDMKRGARNKRNAREAMRQEIMMYGIVQACASSSSSHKHTLSPQHCTRADPFVRAPAERRLWLRSLRRRGQDTHDAPRREAGHADRAAAGTSACA